MHEQNDKFSEEIENIKMYQTEITEFKNTVTELKNSLQGFNSRLDEAEDRISRFKGRAVEFIRGAKRKTKSEDSLRDL